MKTVYAKHEPYENGHLGKVVNDMIVAGQPTIRVVEQNGSYYALEGSHRLAAAYQMGIEPKLVIQIEDCDEGLNEFWEKISSTLPRYDFEAVYVMNLNNFK